LTSSASEPAVWCSVAYWELRQRVGPQFVVRNDHVNIFGDLALGSGLCLAQLQSDRDVPSGVVKVRRKIGSGLILSREADGIWIYNRSRHPLFVSRPPSKPPRVSFSPQNVDRLPPGFALRLFDVRWRNGVAHESPTSCIMTSADGPCNLRSAQISFAKGFGERYSRQTIMSCPCWIEVLLEVKR
jgi:MAD (mothers against decapentaplegic) family protein 6/7